MCNKTICNSSYIIVKIVLQYINLYSSYIYIPKYPTAHSPRADTPAPPPYPPTPSHFKPRVTSTGFRHAITPLSPPLSPPLSTPRHAIHT